MRQLLFALFIIFFACSPVCGQTPEIRQLEEFIDSLNAEKKDLQSRIDSLSARRDSLRTVELRKGSVTGVLITPSQITNAPSITSNVIENRATGDTVRITDGVDAGSLADYGFWEVVVGGVTGYVPRTHVRSEDAWLVFTDGKPDGFEYEGGSSQSSSQSGSRGGSVRTFSGNGIRSTQPFSIDEGWTLSWSSDGNISIMIYKNGNLVSVASGQGSGSSYVEEGGRIYLEVTSTSEWTVRAKP